MKQFYLSLLLCATALSTGFAQNVHERIGIKRPAGQSQIHNVNAPATRATADELLGCPEGTVLGGEFSSEEGDYVGFQSSDQGRPGMPTKFYQYFSNCYNTVNGVRFIGIFNYYDEDSGNWIGCNERGGVDENGNMTENIRFEVSFYKVNEEGEPGDIVFSKEVDLLGHYTGVAYNECNIYEFSVELGETLKMESGFLSVSAVDMGNSPSCWYSPLCCSSIPGYGIVSLGEYGLMTAALQMCYCLKGTGESIAQKALKFNRILSPTSVSGEKYEKVQVELMNIGSEDINNARLELWADGQLLATEDVNATIKSLDSYKYTFKQRIDCSVVGTHQFEVKNVTAGDEKICSDVQEFSTTKLEAGVACASSANSSDYEYITRVTIGDIDNSSEGTNYGDYKNLKTSITAGEELDLTVENEGSGVYIGVWVDWNGNGSFEDEGDFISYITKGSIKLSIPNGVEVTEGEKTMRIILSYGETTPCGSYDYGETEDYTLVVKRPETSPALSINKSYIEEIFQQDIQKTTELEIANNGAATMNGKLAVNYFLPYSPNNRHISKANESDLKKVQPRKAARKSSNSVPTPVVETEYTLKYDKSQNDVISLTSGDVATYATYYPGDMLANISGMKISSIDVYIADAAEQSSVVIYGQNTQSTCGEIITDQAFVPVENAWNHIELATPITVADKDLWIGVKLEGFKKASYQIGIDEGPAIIGFGDVVNIGGTTWWSMGDLGLNSNLCIRANITGKRTPAINWLTLNKSEYTIESNQKENINVSLNATQLSQTLYEAVIEVSSNDVLSNIVKVPVYLVNENPNGINENKVSQSSLVHLDIERNSILVKADKEIRQVMLADVAGNTRRIINVNGETATMTVTGFNSGVYFVCIVYADGSKETVKIPVVR